MKKLFLFIVFFFSAIILLTTTLAQAPPIPISVEKLVVIENNYLAGLESDNLGIRVSSAFFLGEAGTDRAVIPLMKMFKDEDDPGAKFIAAWSLLKIGDKRGVYKVKWKADNCDCESETCIYEYIYKDFSLRKYGRVL